MIQLVQRLYSGLPPIMFDESPTVEHRKCINLTNLLSKIRVDYLIPGKPEIKNSYQPK